MLERQGFCSDASQHTPRVPVRPEPPHLGSSLALTLRTFCSKFVSLCVSVCQCSSVSFGILSCCLRFVSLSSCVCVSSDVSLTVAGTQTLFQVKRVIGGNRERVVLDLLSKKGKVQRMLWWTSGASDDVTWDFFCGAELPMRDEPNIGLWWSSARVSENA